MELQLINLRLPCSAVTLSAMATTTTLSEDTCLNALPSDVSDALKKVLDQAGNWRYLLNAVEDNHGDGPPLDSDLDPDLLTLDHLNEKSPTETLLSKLGSKGYLVCHLRKWLRAKGLVQAADILGGIVLFVSCIRLLHTLSC